MPEGDNLEEKETDSFKRTRGRAGRAAARHFMKVITLFLLFQKSNVDAKSVPKNQKCYPKGKAGAFLDYVGFGMVENR